jgi:hypothetical protein
LDCLADFKGRREKFEYLLEKGIVQHVTKQQTDSALTHLTWDETQHLVLRGANPNAASSSGQTALMRATMNHQCEMVRFLLTHGADPALKDSGGRTALQLGKDARSSLRAAQEGKAKLTALQRGLALSNAILQMLESRGSAGAVRCPAGVGEMTDH